MREAVTGAIELRYRGRLMGWTETPAPPPRPPVTPLTAGRAVVRPSADHPWRRGFDQRQPRAGELARP